MSSGEPVDVAAKSRHAERVGENPGKYWDYNECGWVRYADAEPVVPAPSAPGDDAMAGAEEADVVSG